MVLMDEEALLPESLCFRSNDQDTDFEDTTDPVPSPVDDEEVDNEVHCIRRGAARIKRAEILAQVVATHDSQLERTVMTARQASRVRGLLLSVMDDWRSLAIRCVACLYRLQGILLQEQEELSRSEEGTERFRTQLSFRRRQAVIETAREGLHVYAVLAQRLGMHRLKAKLEDTAFRILYPRQNAAVQSLYRVNIRAWQGLATHLQARILHTLEGDPRLMDQLEDIQVTSRVKEPFSFWKKVLKQKFKKLSSRKKQRKETNRSSADGHQNSLDDTTSEPSSPSFSLCVTNSDSSVDDVGRGDNSLSLTDINDGIALRVILRARKWTPNELPEITAQRESWLCYYARDLVLSSWPDDQGRIKDYIRFPKPNGYQSLHHTSSVHCRGMKIPFEVQVRSEEMHQLAEYGIAAHFDYKLQGNEQQPCSSNAGLLLPEHPSPGDTSVSNLDETEAHLYPSASVATPVVGSGETGAPTANSYVDALVTARRDMLEKQIFVFFASTSGLSPVDGAGHGQLLSLPTNSRVRDVIDAARREDGCSGGEDLFIRNECSEKKTLAAYHNGRLARLDDFVENGDVVLSSL